MATQPKKTVKDLEEELRKAQQNVDDIVDELVEAKRAEAARITKAKAAAERRAKKDRIARKAELDKLLVDYWDVAGSDPAATSSTPAPVVTTRRPVAATPATASTPAPAPAATPTPASTPTPAPAPVAKRSFTDVLKKSLSDFAEGFRS